MRASELMYSFIQSVSHSVIQTVSVKVLPICYNLLLGSKYFYVISFVDEIFKRMFPDSGITKTFHCGEKKTSYLKTFGLTPLRICW